MKVSELIRRLRDEDPEMEIRRLSWEEDPKVADLVAAAWVFLENDVYELEALLLSWAVHHDGKKGSAHQEVLAEKCREELNTRTWEILERNQAWKHIIKGREG